MLLLHATSAAAGHGASGRTPASRSSPKACSRVGWVPDGTEAPSGHGAFAAHQHAVCRLSSTSASVVVLAWWRRSTDPLGHVSRATYDAKGNLKQLVDRDGVITAITYNDRGQPLEQRVGGELKTKFTHDTATGLPTRMDYGATGEYATFEYDESARLLSSRDLGGRVTTQTYGSGCLPLTTTGPDGTMSATYDALGNLASVKDAAGVTVRYTHDELGQLTSFTDGNNRVTRYSYDAYRRLVEVVTRRARRLRTPMRAGRLQTRTDRTGAVTTMSYAPDGQITRRDASDGSYKAYAYDAAGRLTTATSGLSTLTWKWDDANQPVRESLAMPRLDTVAVERTWTAGGQLAGVVDPHGSTSYLYDGQGRLQKVSGAAAGSTTFAYDTPDRLTGLTRGNGLVTSWTYADVSCRSRSPARAALSCRASSPSGTPPACPRSSPTSSASTSSSTMRPVRSRPSTTRPAPVSWTSRTRTTPPATGSRGPEAPPRR